MSTAFPKATIIGYPRIGRRRELKKAVEAYWAGRTSAAELETTAAELRVASYARLTELGLETGNYSIPASFSLYDQVLDTAVTFGAVSNRFKDLYDAKGLEPADTFDQLLANAKAVHDPDNRVYGLVMRGFAG